MRHRPYRVNARAPQESPSITDDPSIVGPLVISLAALGALCAIRVAVDVSHHEWTVETYLALILTMTFFVGLVSEARRWWRCRRAKG